MRRYFESLRPADVPAISSVPDGLLLVRVDRAQYRWHKQKSYYISASLSSSPDIDIS